MIAVAVLAAALATASPVHAASPAAQLRSYLVLVRPIAASETAQLNLTLAALRVLDVADAASLTAVGEVLGAVSVKLSALSRRLAAIKAPPALRGPHSTYVRGIRLEGRALQGLSNALNAGVAGLSPALDLATAAFGTLTVYERNWSEEVIVQLRRAQITVPLWVKQVGK